MTKTADIDVTEALEILADSAWSFSRSCKRLSLDVIRQLLARKPTHATHVYLALAVDADAKDAALEKQWAAAIQGLADLETINRWAGPQKKAKFKGLAKNKRLLAAIQGAAANGRHVSLNMLAVLVTDGSKDSFDALIPNLATNRLDSLRMLRAHAKNTPALRALFAELDDDAEKAGSPAQRIAKLIGLTDAKKFWFNASISSTAPDRVPLIQAHVKVDSRKASWFRAGVTKVEFGDIAGSTSFTNEWFQDELGVGRCEAADVPAWLAKIAKKFRITWTPPYISSGVRGNKRDLIARWLVP